MKKENDNEDVVANANYYLDDENFRLWDLRTEATYIEAACLLLNLDPNKYGSHLPDDVRSKFVLMRNIVEEACTRGELEETTPTGPDAWMAMPFESKISILSLKTFAKKKKLRSPALFPEQRGKQKEAKNTGKKKEDFQSGPGYRSVIYKGKKYSFTTNQAMVIQRLYEAYKNGTPDVSQAYILEDILNQTSSKVKDTFRNHPAWQTLIVTGSTKGTFKLNI